MTDQIEC